MKRVLKNAWYVGAWAVEVPAGQLLSRRLLGEHVVFYRDAEGTAVALADKCPHRFAPLSMGKLVGSELQCTYHGLRFDATGRCTANPHGDGSIPKQATVRAYPVQERYGALWIWMGDPALADPTVIPVFDFLVAEHWATGTGYLMVESHYELETDNILDLSHIEYLHPLFAGEGVSRGEFECLQEGNTVWSKRMIRGDDPHPYVRESFRIPADQLVDRWLDVRWDAPATMALWTGAVPAGTPRNDFVNVPTAHLMTPESDTRTHYFYAMAVSRAVPGAEEICSRYLGDLRAPFECEDKPVLEAVQRRMADSDLLALNPVLLPGDASGIRARRILKKMIEAQATQD